MSNVKPAAAWGSSGALLLLLLIHFETKGEKKGRDSIVLLESDSIRRPLENLRSLF